MQLESVSARANADRLRLEERERAYAELEGAHAKLREHTHHTLRQIVHGMVRQPLLRPKPCAPAGPPAAQTLRPGRPSSGSTALSLASSLTAGRRLLARLAGFAADAAVPGG
eukprot:6943994-Prymnesium_polylepis.2